MLKIKDNVDLKELEKFGIHPIYKYNQNTGESYITQLISERYFGYYGHFIFAKKKKVGLQILARKIINRTVDNSLYLFEDNTYVDVDLIYDLIKADLVEKV